MGRRALAKSAETLPSAQVAGAIAVITLLVYAKALTHDFINLDDPRLIRHNPAIESLAPSAVAAMFVPQRGQTYQPMRVLSYAIDRKIFGEGPFGYHLCNVLLHASAAVLLFLALLALKIRLWPAASAALIWALHPVNVEAVAWAASRKYNLLVLFTFAAVLAWDRRRPVWLAIFAILAMWSSPFGVVLPLLFLLLDWRERTRLKPLLVALFVGLPPVVIGLLGKGGSQVVKWGELSFGERVLAMPWSLVSSAKSLIWPFGLNARYPVHAGGFDLRLLAGVAVLVGVGWAVWKAWQKGQRLPTFCLAWLLITWAPVSGIIPISTQRADRYLYLAGVAPLVGLTLLIFCLPQPRRIALAVVLVLGLLCGLRIGVWADSETLWRDSVAKAPDNSLAWNDLGMALQDADRPGEARDAFARAVDLDDANTFAHFNLGTALMHLGEAQAALSHLVTATSRDANSAAAWKNLGACHAALGDYASSLRALQQAARVDDDFPGVYLNLGHAYANLARTREAIAAFAAAADRGSAEAFYELGRLHFETKPELALAHFQQAITLRPDYAKAHNNLGVWHAHHGDTRQALASFQQALRLDPSSDSARKNVEWAQSKLTTP
jgi:tetratricopeptide (TPR) repeat protein